MVRKHFKPRLLYDLEVKVIITLKDKKLASNTHFPGKLVVDVFQQKCENTK